jgi:hypothetical protein
LGGECGREKAKGEGSGKKTYIGEAGRVSERGNDSSRTRTRRDNKVWAIFQQAKPSQCGVNGRAVGCVGFLNPKG